MDIPALEDGQYKLELMELQADLTKNMSDDAIRKLFMDELVSNSNTSNSNQASINIGDIIIQEAENGNDLANAIINQLPNALLQALYKKS